MTVTDEAIEAFARLSGDRNPVHFDDAFGRSIGFEGRIAHGAVTASLLSAVLGMDLPGPGSVFLEQHLARAGVLEIVIGGRHLELAAYQQGDDLFIPFRDTTSGGETYGAGRYVEAHSLGGDRYELDFNTAYNPYCAYNDAWSCPL